jgi:hypothetical protein
VSALRVPVVQERVRSELTVAAVSRPSLRRPDQRGSNALPPDIWIDIPTFEVSYRTGIAAISERAGADLGEPGQLGAIGPFGYEDCRVGPFQPGCHVTPVRG